MKDPVKRRYVYLMLSIFGGIGLSVVLFFVVYRFRGVGDALNKLGSILAPFAYGGVVAYLLRPMCNLYDGLFQMHLQKKLKKLYIKESDERQAQIVAKALCEAMRATLILGLAAVIVAGYFSMTVSLTLLVTVLLVSLMTLAFKLYFGKKY